MGIAFVKVNTDLPDSQMHVSIWLYADSMLVNINIYILEEHHKGQFNSISLWLRRKLY